MSARLRRFGVLGGSFDPVHMGHLIMAEEAIHRLRLDRLFLVPAGRPAHKRTRALAPVEHRVAMLRLAARGNQRLAVSRIEAGRPGVTYSVRTLETLTRRDPGDWFFVMGQDSMEEFETWREPDRVLSLVRLAVVPRGEGDHATLRPEVRRRTVFLRMPLIGISSTEIRRRLKRGQPVRYWLPDAVLAYVARHGLYGTRTRRG
jgi:nicotinate-nucleotide adenylyltransferase